MKVMRQATRRLDVDTKWLQEHGVHAAKDTLTVEEYHRVRNHLEDKYNGVRLPAAKFAEENKRKYTKGNFMPVYVKERVKTT